MDINQLPGSLATSGESSGRALLKDMVSQESIGRSRLPNYLLAAPYTGMDPERRDYANVDRMTPGSLLERLAESSNAGGKTGGGIAPSAYGTAPHMASFYSRNCCN